MDDIYPQEIIKEYLEHNKLSSTLECFQAEIKSKSLVKKSRISQDTATHLPRLYTLCMGDGAKSANQSATEKRLEQSTKRAEVLLSSSKKIFEIAVSCISLLEEHKISESQVSRHKLELSKLQHEVGLRALHSEESPILSSGYIQELRNQIIHCVQSKELPLLAQELLKVRVECLSVPQHYRLQLITKLEENDIFGGSLNLLLNMRNHAVISATAALVSILCSAEAGKRYVLGNNAVYIVTLLIKHLQQEEKGSVCQRFVLACLEKLSLHDAACVGMIDSNLIEWVCQNMIVHNNHTFIYMFASALIANLIKFNAGQAHVSQHREAFVVILHNLLSFAIAEDVELEVVYHCVLASSYLHQVFPDLSLASEITHLIEVIRNSEKKGEDVKAVIFDVCNRIINKNHLASHQKKPSGDEGNEVEQIFFECFTDESPLL